MNQKNEPTAQGADLLCHKCKAVFSFEVGIKERPETRGDVVGVTEHGIECPNCHHWTHAYWLNIGLENQRREMSQARKLASRPNRTQKDILRFTRLKKQYEGAYDRFQNLMYKTTGTKPTLVKAVK